jgi:hypothetical protein
VWWALGVLVILAGTAAFWFRSYLPTLAAIVGYPSASSAITEFTIPTSHSALDGIAAGSDGALWFTESSVSNTANKIGRITTTGAFTDYSISTSNNQRMHIASGPDGALWFTEDNGNKIGRLVPPSAAQVLPPATPGDSNPADADTDGHPRAHDGLAGVASSRIAASDVVHEFYRLWNAHQLRDAYTLLSARYRSDHPFGEWEKTHVDTLGISVETKPTNDPMMVRVVIDSEDKSASGSTKSRYRGTWTAVREGSDLKLNKVALDQDK